ncbi:ABC transporter permease [Anoxybacillus thermarum]|nr:ABC transporter permease [Anoxybacillus thermarum]
MSNLYNFINLVRNENMKLYLQRSNQVMMVLLIIFVIAGAIIVTIGSKQHDESENLHWKTDLKEYNEHLEKLAVEHPELKQSYMKEIALNTYRINHNLKPISDDNIWSFVKDMGGGLSLASIFTIIVAASFLTNEFKWGTIKLLLIRPYSRTQILLSKYLVILIYALVLHVLLFISSWFIGGLFFGFEGAGQPYLKYQDGKVIEINMITYVLSQYGIDSIKLLMMATFAFMISSVFRNISLSIGLSITLLLAGNSITMLFNQFSWAKYTLFTNLDLISKYFSGDSFGEGTTLLFSLLIILVHYIFFIGVTWFSFTYRDVEV